MTQEGGAAVSRSARERRFSRTFLVSGGLTLAGVLLVAVGGSGLKALGVLLVVLDSPVFAVSAVRHLLRGLLWRVGSRLFVSYLLIGVVPLPFLLGLVLAGAYVLSGQLGARRAVDALAGRAGTMQRLARDLADGQPAGPLVARGVPGLPGLSAAVARAESPFETTGQAVPPFAVAGPGVPAGVVARSGERSTLVVGSSTERGRAVLAVPLDEELAAALTRETGVAVALTISLEKGDDVHVDPSKGARSGPDVEAALGEGKGLLRGRWVNWLGPAPFDVVDGTTGAPLRETRTVVWIRTSIAGELERLFSGVNLGSRKDSSAAAVVVVLMKVLVGIVVLVYVSASLLSAILVTRIARAAKRLSLGMAAVERGDFSHRARLPGRDQLAALVGGFNQMASHLETNVAERAEREALGRELETARSLQRRLLPSPDFTFPGLEIATDFRPAAAIGGDFYHLLPESDTRLSVVIADVSGHGLGAGIVMASAKASLSALAATGMDAPALLTQLDEEIRKSTEARTFVTLAHLRFDLAERSVAYTNAGHVYPWVVRASGTVASVANPARPLGLGLPVRFQTVMTLLEAGDLWVLVSDGIVEARSTLDEEFGFERLERILAESAGATAAELSSRILVAWRAHTGTDEPEDDRTLLVLRVL